MHRELEAMGEDRRPGVSLFPHDDGLVLLLVHADRRPRAVVRRAWITLSVRPTPPFGSAELCERRATFAASPLEPCHAD